MYKYKKSYRSDWIGLGWVKQEQQQQYQRERERTEFEQRDYT